MQEIYLYAWEIFVALGIFGYGLTGCRVLGLKRSALAVAGVLGVSLWIALGGVLNLLHLLRPGVFFKLAASGVGLAIVELGLRHRASRVDTTKAMPAQQERSSTLAKIAVAAAALLMVTLVVGSMRVRHWSNDDLEEYIALSIKAAQNHSLQPDPFSQRRVQSGLSGGNFLDTLMFATGDIRAMIFIDSSFGFALYALAIWEIGRRWRVPLLGVAITVLCLPLAPLMKINLTIVYLSAAGFLALLLLLTDAPDEEPFSIGRVVALGLIIGAVISTKTPNIVFVLPIPLGIIVLYRLFRARYLPLLPLVYALLIAVATLVPWAIASRANSGTYLFPVLGLGDHVTAYHLIWKQGNTGSWQQNVLLAAPNLCFLALCFAVAWNLTRSWAPAARAAILSYIGSALIALPVCIQGLGGEMTDRYTAPLVMPVYLLTLLLVFGATRRVPAFWRYAGIFTLLITGLYTVLFIDIHLMWLFETKTILYQAFGRLPHHKFANVYLLNEKDIEEEFAHGARIQASIPAGASALDVSNRSFHFDFRRNRIYNADVPGMSSPPPGLPLNGSPATQRQFLVDHGVDYLIFERKNPLSCDYNTELKLGNADWPRFLKDQREHYSFYYLLTHETFTHSYGPWNLIEFFVPCHERGVFQEIISASPQVYNDGDYVVARLR